MSSVWGSFLFGGNMTRYKYYLDKQKTEVVLRMHMHGVTPQTIAKTLKLDILDVKLTIEEFNNHIGHA